MNRMNEMNRWGKERQTERVRSVSHWISIDVSMLLIYKMEKLQC